MEKNIIIQHTAGGDDADVGQDHGDDQGDDGTGNLRSPLVLLFQEDREGHGQTHDAQKAPGVVRCDQRFPSQQVHKDGIQQNKRSPFKNNICSLVSQVVSAGIVKYLNPH